VTQTTTTSLVQVVPAAQGNQSQNDFVGPNYSVSSELPLKKSQKRRSRKPRPFSTQMVSARHDSLPRCRPNAIDLQHQITSGTTASLFLSPDSPGPGHRCVFADLSMESVLAKLNYFRNHPKLSHYGQDIRTRSRIWPNGVIAYGQHRNQP
jgi:hypothetical protein